MANDQEILELLQNHTKSNVSENFVKVIRRLKLQNEQDKNGFINKCKALGKFADSDVILGKVFDMLGSNDGQKSAMNPIKIEKKPVLLPQQKKRKFKITLEDDSNEDIDEGGEEDELDLPGTINPFIKKPPVNAPDIKGTPAIKFKRLKKKDADRLKEYSAQKSVSPIPMSIEKSQLKPTEDDSSVVTQVDKDWYDFDDDYGNPVSEEIEEINELGSQLNKTSHNSTDKNYHIQSSIYQDALHSEIQLNILPTEQRKKWLPPFLIDYAKKYSITNDEIIGATVQLSNVDDTINPFRNPESDFSVNARKGSGLVNKKRLQREQTQRAKEQTAVEGTKIGNALGLNNEISHEKSSANTSNKYDKPSYNEDIKATRQSLPAYKSRNSLLSMIRENQVSIIIGETGSGKTTQLPQYLYEDGFTSNGKIIGVTQPRRVAAMSVAKRVAQEMDVKIKEEVGYTIRFEDFSSSNTKIKFMTDGILLREALLDNDLDKYSCIMIDEAHERTLNTDVMLGILKDLLQRRKDLKLIITSATMNAMKFSKFFGNAPQFTIPGRTFPVEMNYTKYPVSDYVEAAVKQAVNIHMSTSIQSGDILIFMTGQEDVEVTTDTIRERLLELYRKKGELTSPDDDLEDIEIYPIYSALAPELQNRIFRKLDANKRKIVIATNIAETSLTIDGIRYVIDCGYSKLKVYNPRIGLDALATTPISLANANQRSGRAGRTAPGIAYRLYTEETAENDMYSSTIPEIQRTNLSNTVLLLKSLGIKNILDFAFIDMPPIQTLLSSLYELWSMGAIDNFGELTKLGIEMSKLPLQPALSKILLKSVEFGCSSEMLIIVSMLSIPQIFQRPKGREKESDKARGRFFIAGSDHLTLLNVYLQWKSNGFSSKWCSKFFMQSRSLAKAEDIRKQLLRVIETQNIRLKSIGSNWDVIRHCICTGFSHQAAKLSGLKRYSHLRTGMHTQIHPTSALFGMGDLPQYVIYNELLMTSSEYLVCVTAVDPFWLMESGLLLYDMKKQSTENEYTMGILDNNSSTRANKFEFEGARKLVSEKLANCIQRRKVLIDNMARDAVTYREKLPQNIKLDNSKKENKTSNSSGSFIGFKRRRPF